MTANLKSDQSGVLKTPEEWDLELHPLTQIWDSDGWRGSKDMPWTEPLTREEFEHRRVWCTIGPRVS